MLGLWHDARAATVLHFEYGYDIAPWQRPTLRVARIQMRRMGGNAYDVAALFMLVQMNMVATSPPVDQEGTGFILGHWASYLRLHDQLSCATYLDQEADEVLGRAREALPGSGASLLDGVLAAEALGSNS
ncbi:MAG: hypothetical protein JNL41_05470 [Phenylobacterium sp.]|uniref:hypothetical protein n=1 Tax=Phenylobacterium sp. TaxID=1871053 RepID=UPI001A4FC45B|nr:hypothetical protein [Phenylobacterium sp.]MBL8553706.1 hypothetical protein [Phenylobacterium sp.]